MESGINCVGRLISLLMGAARFMFPDLDIYRSALVLGERRGPDAPIHAAMRADPFQFEAFR